VRDEPLPPCLVIRPRLAFWIEPRARDGWRATPEAFQAGCYEDASCYDESGRLWPIVAARLARPPSWLERLVSRPVPVTIEFGDARPIPLKEVRSLLAGVLREENEFGDDLPLTPTALIERLAGAHTPRELIRVVRGIVA
jgi:hypothetical protein